MDGGDSGIMDEYIERANLIARIKYYVTHTPKDKGEHYAYSVMLNEILNRPAADVVPVVHGRWIEKTFLMGTSNFCSLCGCHYGMPHEKYNFCPNCGAKMDGGADNV